MVLLALRCIVTDHRHRHLQHFVRRPARGLASLQGPRGSFGSLRSTALAMQALEDVDPDPASKWSRASASKWILDRQRSDGGWTEEPLQDGQDPDVGIGLTADIILALGWKGMGAVRALQCNHVLRDSYYSENGENGETSKLATIPGVPSLPEESEGNFGLRHFTRAKSHRKLLFLSAKNVSYTYTLWVGSNVSQVFTLSLTSSKNTSFFRAMTQAAELDPRYYDGTVLENVCEVV
jgi:gastric intrinsic factor